METWEKYKKEINKMKKVELIVFNNNLLLGGVDLQKFYNVKIEEVDHFNHITNRTYKVKRYSFNNKVGYILDDCFTWREKTILSMIK